MIFDKNFVFKTGGFKRLSDLPKENGTDVPHEKLAFEGAERIIVKESGYVYIYLSNENDTPVEVYFDDFKVKHSKGPIVSSQDYYPFGLAFNSYQRENSIQQPYQYNGKEIQDELNLQWMDYGARMYDAQIGRWHVVDPMTDKTRDWTPYRYAYNNPMIFIDPTGMEEEKKSGADKGGFQYVKGAYGESILVGGGMSSDAQRVNGNGEAVYNVRENKEGAGVKLGQTASQVNDIIRTQIGDVLGGMQSPKDAQEGASQTWYFMSRESGSPHGLVYDPYTGTIYEVNHPARGHGLLLQLEGMLLNSVPNNGNTFSETKSVPYQWSRSDKEQWANFWARESGSTFLLSPVTVTNPAAATAWFQSRQGTAFNYNFFTNNCAHYATQGLNAGGAGVNFIGPKPSSFPVAPTMSWSAGQAYPVPIK